MKKLLLIKSCRLDQFEYNFSFIKEKNSDYEITAFISNSEQFEFKKNFTNIKINIFNSKVIYFFDLIFYLYKEKFSKIIFFYNDYNHKTYHKIEIALIFSFLSNIGVYDIDNTYKEYSYFKWLFFHCLFGKFFLFFESIISYLIINLLLFLSEKDKIVRN